MLALVKTASAPAGRSGARNQDGKRERNNVRVIDERRRYRPSVDDEDEEYRSDPASDHERPPNVKPGRRATFQRAGEDAESPAARFVNQGTVQNQVGGAQHVDGGMYFGNAINDIYHTGGRRQQEPAQKLRRTKTNFTAQDVEHEHPLKKAAFFGEHKVVKSLIRARANVNRQGGMFGTALQAAAANGQARVVTLLLSEGAEVNAVGGEFGSALHAAAAAGCVNTVMVLIAAGANVHATGGRYGTVMDAALSQRDNLDVVDVLVDAGASVDA